MADAQPTLPPKGPEYSEGNWRYRWEPMPGLRIDAQVTTRKDGNLETLHALQAKLSSAIQEHFADG